MKFFVNFLSGFRIFASFAIIGTLMSGMYITTLILFLLGTLSDFFDGYLARKYNVCTRMGCILDSIADKFLVVNTLILLCIMMPVWFIVIPSIIMIARELYISGLREFAGAQKVEIHATNTRMAMGKIKTFFQMIAIIAFLGLFVLGVLANKSLDSRMLLYAIYALPNIGIFSMWFALAASIISAIQYTRRFMMAPKKSKK